MTASSNAAAFWRQAGFTYLQYLGIASKAVRASLKEPSKSKALAREAMFYNKSILGEKVPVKSSLPN